MSVSFRAILNRGVESKLRPGFQTKLTNLTDEVSQSLRKLGCDNKRIGKANWKWNWNSDVDADFKTWLAQPYIEIFFDEPPIIAIGFNSKLSVVNLAASWLAFTAKSEIQEEVRRLIRCVGRSLSANSAVYVPDSGWRVAQKIVENVEDELSFEEWVKLLMFELQTSGSFSDTSKAVCSAWPIFFDRW